MAPIHPIVTPYDELTAWLRVEGTPFRLSRPALDEARRHGVHLVIAQRAHRAGAAGAECIEGYAELIRELRTASIIEAARTCELERVIETLAGNRIHTLVFKGAALANSIYPEPYLRPSSDFDLLIRPEDRQRAVEVIWRCGYASEDRITSDLIMPQQCMTRRMGSMTHVLDVHWKLVNPVAYADLLTFDALWSRSVHVPRLSIHARMPALDDHLIVSCLHRLAHHHNSNHLIWLYDIHLLAHHLEQQHIKAIVDRARARKLARVCYVSLQMAEASFGVNPDLLAAFASAAEPDAIADAFLSPHSAQVSLLQADWRALSGVRARLRLLREHLFPSIAYMRSVYPWIPAPLVPLGYVLRVLRGAPKWFTSAA